MQLAGQGAVVIVHGRDVERGAAVVGQIELAGNRARFAPANLSDAQVRRAARQPSSRRPRG